MMKTTYLLALAMLAVLAFAAGAAYADVNQNAEYNYNYGYSYQVPPGSIPATTGTGPLCCPTNAACPTTDLCNVVPEGTCGAFCTSGQPAPGWPYNWCSEYWLRPNSNF